MPTIANLPAADVPVTFPSGTTKTVNMLRLLVQVQNAEMKAKHGRFLPGIAKQHPTVKALREEYEIPAASCRNWEEAAVLLRAFHTTLKEHIAKALAG